MPLQQKWMGTRTMTRLASTPEIDASASEINLRMTEGDLLNFQWTVLAAAAWAGAYTAWVTIDGDDIPLTATAVAVSADALFTIASAPIAELVRNSSGYEWRVKQTGGLTRFGGLLFVEE